MLRKTAAWLMLTAAGPAMGAEYFLSPGGSDAAAGTRPAPWQTIATQTGNGKVLPVRSVRLAQEAFHAERFAMG
jgi:hypothetical protein